MTKPLRPAFLLGVLVAAYILVALLYAAYTPAWQVPDEPAHYNYARYVAEKGRLPVLHPGDYPHEYLEIIKARRFPPDMSIGQIRYEFHQPPLYYLFAAGVYALFAKAGLATQVIALRLLSVLFGALLLIVSYLSVATILPRRPALALGATAFSAFLPMRVAMSAGINNDSLAYLLLGVALLLLLRYLLRAGEGEPEPRRNLLLLGVVLGLLMITKSSVYIAVPLAGLALIWGEATRGRPGRRLAHVARALAWVAAPALLIAAPWWIRNAAVYGGLDILGLGRHDAIVQGQLRTAEWIAQVGFGPALAGFLRTAFQSFWGQFGWMGVLLHGRLYDGLRLFSALTLLGAALALWQFYRRRPALSAGQRAALALLGLTLLFNLATFAWYNVQFLQPQGRYLFGALLPIGLLAAAGWRSLLTRRGSAIAAGALVLGALALLGAGLARGDLPLFWLAVCGAGAAAFAGRALLLPAKWSAGLAALPYVGMLALDFVCLFGYIVPQLRG